MGNKDPSPACILPADAPALVSAPAERLHPLFLLTGLGKAVRGAWGLAVGGAFLAFQDRLGLAIVLLAGFILLSAVSLVVRWLRFEYRVERDEIRIDSGFLSRTSRAIPFDRITDIDIEQRPLHRLFGLARVRFETGAAGAGKTEDGMLDTIALERAEALREYVRERRGGAPAGPATVDRAERQSAEASPLFAMDLRRVVIAGVFNFSLAVIAALVGFTQTLGNFVGFDPFRRSFWENALQWTGPLREILAAHQIASAVAGACLLLVMGLGTGIIRTLVREFGFRLDRTESGFRRRRGLLTLTDVSIPARRVQAAIVATGPIRRRFGWRALKLQSLADDAGGGNHVVAPLASADEVGPIEASIGYPPGPNAERWRPISSGYFKELIPLVAVAISGALVVAWLIASPLPLGAAVAALLALAIRYFAWRQTRYALDNGFLFIERGWWRQQLLILPVGKVQSVDLAQSFWSRWFDHCALRLGVAGGKLLSVHSVPALAPDEGLALREQLVGR